MRISNYNYTLVAFSIFGLIFEIIIYIISLRKLCQYKYKYQYQCVGIVIFFCKLCIYIGSIFDTFISTDNFYSVLKLFLVVFNEIFTCCIYFSIEYHQQSYLTNIDEFKFLKKFKK